MGNTAAGVEIVKRWMEDDLGIYVYTVQIGDTTEEDFASTYIGNVGEQVEFVCGQIREQPELAGGYNGIGFSQGSQFMRAVLQRCQNTGPKMERLITLGGQHQGVMACKLPCPNTSHSTHGGLYIPPSCPPPPHPPLSCSSTTSIQIIGLPLTSRYATYHAVPQCPQPSENEVGFNLCNFSHDLISFGAYSPWVRKHIVQAQFWRDPWELDNYRKFSEFLADINNDRNSAEKNHQYRDNILSLKEMVLYRFAEESVVVPRDSSWFSVFDAEQNRVVPLQETALYKEDWIGLKELEETGRLTLLTAPGDHMHFGKEWFADNIYPFLKS